MFGRAGIDSTPLNEQLYMPGITDRCENMMHGARAGWFGWAGLGGSIFQWHPEHKIGFGYATTDLYRFDMVNARASIIQEAVVTSIKAMNRNSKSI